MNIPITVSIFILTWNLPSTFTLQHRAPVLDLPSGTESYRGTIKRSDGIVTISPGIRVLEGTGPVCSYEITPLTTTDLVDQPNIDHVNHTLHRRSVENAAKKVTNSEQDKSSESEDSGEDDLDDEDLDILKDGTTTAPKNADGLAFRVDVTDKTSGKAIVRVNEKEVMDCKKKAWAFKIAPKKCGSGESIGDSVTVKVRVLDANDHEPTLDSSIYAIKVQEGRLYDNEAKPILKLKTFDGDCGYYGEICRYEILNDQSGSFEVTKSGILKIVKPLSSSPSTTQNLSIIAEDCGKRRSNPSIIKIEITPVCQIGLSASTDRVSYGMEDGAKPFASNISVQLCDMDCSEVKDIQGKIKLGRLAGIDSGCDRERYDAKSLQNTCGADIATVDLLPNLHNMPAKTEDSSHPTAQLLDENSVLSDHDFFHSANVFAFDGEKNALIVPPETAHPHIPDAFTLSFWMKHDKPRMDSKIVDGKSHKIKENILCSSDDHRLNRHHFAVYIRNCKLEVLIRRETPNKKGESEFQPAEWRWHVPQACDNQWHHYSINMKFPQLDLFVDGKPVQQSEDNLEILDDWPLREVDGMKTKLVVGACWHGASGKMTQFFNGFLAEMTYLPGKVERPSVLPCTLLCKEQLDFTNLKRLKAGEEAVFNGDMSELTLKASDMTDYVSLLRKVAYSNHKSYPTPGQRTITISTTFTCVRKQTEKVQVPSKIFYVDVKRANDPVIKIEGTSTLDYPQSDLEQGVNLFPSLKINVQASSFGPRDLDYCKIRTKPGLNKEREYFSSPAALISSLSLDFLQVNDGLLLKGSEKSNAYEALLQQIHYFNSHPSDFKKRTFTVQCTALNGRVKSNEFAVTMRIQAPLMRELKPMSMDNQTGIGGHAKDGDEKMRPPTTNSSPSPSAPHLQHVVANVISETSTSRPVHALVSDKIAKTQRPTPMFEQRKNIPHLLLHEEPTIRHHHLTLDKLAADAPRPSLGGPLPLLHQADLGEAYGNGAVAGTGSAVAVVIVVCVGFLLLLIVVGIIKIRSTHRRMMARQHRRLNRGDNSGEAGIAQGDLAWDDAGMNITVNPLEVLSAPPESREQREDDYSDASSDDDDGSYREEDEECSDDEEDEQVLPHVSSMSNCRNGSVDSATGASTTGGLEWDDTTLSQSNAHNHPRTQTYRV